MSNRERFHCMISTCSWYYERDSGPTSAELERAIMFGPADASLDRAARTNAILREHFKTHALEDWAAEIGRERQRANKAEKELAELGTEWAVHWRTAGDRDHYEACEDEQDAREAIPDGDENYAVVKRFVGDWKVASE